MRPRAAIHDHDGFIVRQRRFRRAGIFRRNDEAVEKHAGLRRAKLKPAGQLAAFLRHRLRQLGDGLHGFAAFPGVDGQKPRDDFFAGKTVRRDLRLHRHRRILKRRLRHRRARHREIALRPFASDDDGIDRRQTLQGQGFARIGRDAVGQQDDAGERLSAVAFGELREGVAERGGASVKGEFAEILRRLEAGVGEVIAHVEIVRERRAPVAPRAGDDAAQHLPARLARARIVQRHAQRIVGDDRNDVRARLGALAGKRRLQQTREQRGKAEHFQNRTRQPQRRACRRAEIRPGDENERGAQRANRRPKPAAPCEEERGEVHGGAALREPSLPMSS